MRESPFEQYSTYFEDVANRHPDIKWFYEIDEDEIISGIRSTKIKYPCLMLEFPEPAGFDNSTNTDVKMPSGLAILSPCKAGDFKKRREILISHEKMILDVISQLRQDRILGNFFIDTNQLRWSKVGPMFTDMLYGWRLDFQIQRWLDLNYYEDQWNEYNPDKFK